MSGKDAEIERAQADGEAAEGRMFAAFILGVFGEHDEIALIVATKNIATARKNGVDAISIIHRMRNGAMAALCEEVVKGKRIHYHG